MPRLRRKGRSGETARPPGVYLRIGCACASQWRKCRLGKGVVLTDRSIPHTMHLWGIERLRVVVVLQPEKDSVLKVHPSWMDSSVGSFEAQQTTRHEGVSGCGGKGIVHALRISLTLLEGAYSRLAGVIRFPGATHRSAALCRFVMPYDTCLNGHAKQSKYPCRMPTSEGGSATQHTLAPSGTTSVSRWPAS